MLLPGRMVTDVAGQLSMAGENHLTLPRQLQPRHRSPPPLIPPRLSLHKRQVMSHQRMRLVGEDQGGEVDPLLSVEEDVDLLIEGVEEGSVAGVGDRSLHPCRHN